MDSKLIERFYRAFGNLVRQNRENRQLTQEKLGQIIGLSRTSVTNIEKGRQHIALHQLFSIADALQMNPAALLPSAKDGSAASWVADKLPPGTEKNITEWAEKLMGGYTSETETS